MAVPWGLVSFLIGLVYGWASPGRQNKMALFKTGLLWGIVIGLVFLLIGALAGVNPLGLGTGILAMIIGVLVIVLLFVLGVWLGDVLEGATKKKQRA